MRRLYLAVAVLVLGVVAAFAQFSGSGFGVSGFGNVAPSATPPASSVMITEDDNKMLTEDGNYMVIE